MDADLWFNTYKRYKSGTTKFTTWLIEAVQNCGQSLAGITSVSAPSTAPFRKNAKKKAGKATEDALTQTNQSKYLIPIRDFTKLAEVIVKSTKQSIQVPSSILALLDDVISLRKEYSRWVGQAAAKSQAQYESHLYFVSVLQEVKGILRRNECAVSKGRRPDGKENTDPQEKKTANLFEALTLEEPKDVEDSPDSFFSVSTGPNAKSTTTSKPIYDMEFLHDEVLFSSVFFFQDLEAIREFVRKTWSGYRAGRTELSTASLLTNTAIEMIQRSTREHLDSIKRWPDAPAEKDFISWFFAHTSKEAITGGEKPGDYVHMMTYEQADRISWPVSVFLEENLSAFEAHRMIWYGYDILDLSRECDEMLAKDKLEEDRIFINLMCIELFTFNKCIKTQPPATDEITRYFIDFESKEHISLWFVFAVQLMVDMKWVLRAHIHHGLRDLTATSRRGTDTVRQYFRESRKILGRREKWHQKYDGGMLTFVRLLNDWVEKDLITTTVNELSKKTCQSDEPSVPPFYLLKHHPILCGLMIYWIEMENRELGVALAMTYKTILATAHLYNAARQSGLLPVVWRDMEYLISVHKPQYLFVGGLPTTPEDCFKRFRLAFGVNVSNFAPNRRSKRLHIAKDIKSERDIQKMYPLYSILRGRYCQSDSHAKLAVDSLDAIITSLATKVGNEDSFAQICEQWAKTKKLTSVQLLSVLWHALEDDELQKNFDYVSMHIRCAALLKDLRNSFIAECPTIQSASAEDLELFRQLEIHLTPIEFLQECVMPDHDPAYIFIADAVFKSDPAASVAVETFNHGGQAQLEAHASREPMVEKLGEGLVRVRVGESWLLRKGCGVSLERAAKAIKDCIDREGSLEVELGLSLCASHARHTFAAAGTTSTNAATTSRSFDP